MTFWQPQTDATLLASLLAPDGSSRLLVDDDGGDGGGEYGAILAENSIDQSLADDRSFII